MYATVPLPALLKASGFVVLAVFAVLLLISGLPDTSSNWLRRFTLTLTVASLAIAVIFGPTSPKWAIWRWVWWLFPILNETLFPDLNGTWVGKGQSNWSRVKHLRDSASSSRKIDPERIDEVLLTDFEIALFIKASLFDLKILGKLRNTNSTSYSKSARVSKGGDDKFRLDYSYDQQTREIAASDESNHEGAASLVVEQCNRRLVGRYWTRRMWHIGLNTAGNFDLVKVDHGRAKFEEALAPGN
ncbi:MAG TPA: hypothetical protein VGC35_07360 [Allosphingosinicella sp.]|jgi:hypothetical protein